MTCITTISLGRKGKRGIPLPITAPSPEKSALLSLGSPFTANSLSAELEKRYDAELEIQIGNFE
jgi:hypothetical protein